MVKANELQIIVFSFNRPWQLKEYLRTFRKYVSADIKPKVIWKASNEAFKKAYEDLFVKGWCEPISEEEHKGKFKELVLRTIDTKIPYLMFGVDDVLYYDTLTEVIWGEIKYLLHHSFGYSLRLAPNITFCQPANNINKVPKFQKHFNSLIYNRKDGWGDWDYPFELCGTVYKTEDISLILRNIEFNNPNELEAEGAKLFMGIGNPHAHINACGLNTLCSVVTINRVQSTYLNPIYSEKTPEELLELYWASAQYDEEWYTSQTFDRIHIGDFRLKSPGKRLSEMIMSGHKQGEDIIWDSLGGLEHKEGAD